MCKNPKCVNSNKPTYNFYCTRDRGISTIIFKVKIHEYSKPFKNIVMMMNLKDLNKCKIHRNA